MTYRSPKNPFTRAEISFLLFAAFVVCFVWPIQFIRRFPLLLIPLILIPTIILVQAHIHAQARAAILQISYPPGSRPPPDHSRTTYP